MKFTRIAKAIGFTTTKQLHNAMGSTTCISSNSIIGLIANLNVNPIFLFIGKGEMFLTDENELEVLQKEKSEWERKYMVCRMNSLNVRQNWSMQFTGTTKKPH